MEMMKMTSQEMEKFLEGLSRYLYRLRMEQQVNHQMMSPSQENDDPDDVAAMPATRNHIGSSLLAEEKSPSEPASNSVMYPRPSSAKWPWPMENTERDGSYLKQQRPTYGKRNSELINSLLGLPRFMKVVGWTKKKKYLQQKKTKQSRWWLSTNVISVFITILVISYTSLRILMKS